MAFRFSIGVVTYLGRFDTYFKPLLRRLNLIFPDYDIIVFLNGHHNLEKADRLLTASHHFSGAVSPGQVFDQHQSPAPGPGLELAHLDGGLSTHPPAQ